MFHWRSRPGDGLVVDMDFAELRCLIFRRMLVAIVAVQAAPKTRIVERNMKQISHCPDRAAQAGKRPLRHRFKVQFPRNM